MIYKTLAKTLHSLYFINIWTTAQAEDASSSQWSSSTNGEQSVFFSNSRDCLLTYFQYWSSVLLIVIKLKFLAFGGIEPAIY